PAGLVAERTDGGGEPAEVAGLLRGEPGVLHGDRFAAQGPFEHQGLLLGHRLGEDLIWMAAQDLVRGAAGEPLHEGTPQHDAELAIEDDDALRQVTDDLRPESDGYRDRPG